MEAQAQEPNQEPIIQKHEIKEIILFENRISELMFAVAARLSSKVKSFQMMTDDDFTHRKDRKTNEIHVLLELKNGQYFHLKAYTRHMLDLPQIPTDQILLTGYTKPSISQIGGTHALRQDWYKWDAETIANEVTSQNPELF